MSKGVTTALVAVAIAVIAVLILAPYLSLEDPRATLPIHNAAANGNGTDIQRFADEGTNVNALDEQGRTPLHHAAQNGHMQTTQILLDLGADPNIRDDSGRFPLDYAASNSHDGTAGILGAVTNMSLANAPADNSAEVREQSSAGQTVNPNLKYPDLTAYETAISERGLILKDEHVWLFAPEFADVSANTVFPYLVNAYGALHEITGVHTEYPIVVYHFPPGHADAKGGTSNCVIWYGYDNLYLDRHDEWTQHAVPHVSGYIEEMAHNFVAATKAQFGWEMIGWSIGVKATGQVADNPVFQRHLQSTRQTQAQTFARYKQNGHVFPADIAPNLADRIHAHLLYTCEQEYGPDFWPDFFTEIRKDQQALVNAISLGEGDATRNERYRITIAAFDRLPGLSFTQRLKQNGISTTTDIKSLNPTDPGWNRKFE